MQLLPAPIRPIGRKKGPAPILTGLAAALSLIVAGSGGALAYALARGGGIVWISPFLSWWVALSCGAGGLIAGRRGGPGVWWLAGQIGLLGGGLVLALLALLVPESLGPGDLFTYCLLPAGLSCAGALAGANMMVRLAPRERPASRAFSALRERPD
jgi:hypothetical protein